MPRSQEEQPPQQNIEIQSPEGALVASINPKGAYLESLTAPDGHDLLMPRQEIGEKVRGGIPVCAPIFGPGEKVGLNQHGFARDLAWTEDKDARQGNSVRFRLNNPTQQEDGKIWWSEYAGCAMSLGIELSSYDDVSQLIMSLQIDNEGEVPFVVSPGFHPYFPMDSYDRDLVEVTNDDQTNNFDLRDLKEADQLPKNQYGYLEFFNGRDVVCIITNGLPVPVLWTDNPKKYLCVEPTSAGAVTGDGSKNIPSSCIMDPGESRKYSMRIEWAPPHGDTAR
jgi:D-hexose-6-phosphate mutarotase